MKFSPLFLAVSAILSSTAVSANTVANTADNATNSTDAPTAKVVADSTEQKALKDIEVIQVKGSYFNGYKVDNANGALR